MYVGKKITNNNVMHRIVSSLLCLLLSVFNSYCSQSLGKCLPYSLVFVKRSSRFHTSDRCASSSIRHKLFPLIS